MTRAEAIKALEEGRTLRHEYFLPDEWVRVQSPNFYLIENGIQISKAEYWKHRNSSGFDKGWSIVEGK